MTELVQSDKGAYTPSLCVNKKCPKSPLFVVDVRPDNEGDEL